ncbi:diacylglycerol/lipid kinase family protein, partial [Thermodesulfobacteriota bacterium]
MRAKAIVNPASSNGSTGKQWPMMEEKLRRAIGDVDAALTAGPGEAVEMTRRALRDGYDWIISVGGDGTLNEVVNGFFAGAFRLPAHDLLG